MNPVFLLRLVLDGTAAGLLLFALAYFWQGNLSHEWAGMGLFLLLVIHGVFHRRWFAGLAEKGQGARRGTFDTVLSLVLMAGMLALLGTSLVISQALFAGLRLNDDFTARQVHAGIAYWLLIIVAIHLGLRWPRLIAVARKLLGLAQPNAFRTAVLRLIAWAAQCRAWPACRCSTCAPGCCSRCRLTGGISRNRSQLSLATAWLSPDWVFA